MSQSKRIWIITKRIIKAFVSLFLYVLFLILVICFYKDIYDMETKLITINGNSFTSGELIAVITFLFGIILTFNIHYYDQIEPKYSLSAEEYKKDLLFERSCQVFNISMLTIINALIVIQYFSAFRVIPFFVSPEQNLLVLLFTDFVYLLICVVQQVNKWGENIKKDREAMNKDK